MRKFIVTSFFALWLAHAGAVSALSQETQPGFSSLSLSAEPEKAGAAPGQPLCIKLRLTNPTQSEVATLRNLDPAYGRIQVYVSRDGGEFKRYLGPGWGAKDLSAGNDARLLPGESVSGEITLLFHNAIRGREDLLDSSVPAGEAGVYQIRVELYDGLFRQVIAAPETKVEVAFPRGYNEQSTSQAVKDDKGLAYFMQTGDARQSESVVAKAEQLVQDYPDTDQTKHFALALGKYYLAQGQVETASAYLKEAAASEPASVLRGLALLELMKSYIGKGEVSEALKLCDDALGEYDGGGVREEFERLGAKVRQAKKLPLTGKGGAPQ
jgi:tetratricopeptide (TPR) repeat protein